MSASAHQHTRVRPRAPQRPAAPEPRWTTGELVGLIIIIWALAALLFLFLIDN